VAANITTTAQQKVEKTMWYELYTNEKLRELEAERRARAGRRPQAPERPLGAPLLRRAGRTLRRLGEGLESWAGPAHGEAAENGRVRIEDTIA
jgi:hypothetical protein